MGNMEHFRIMRNVPLVSLVTVMNGILLKRGIEAILFLNVIYIVHFKSYTYSRLLVSTKLGFGGAYQNY